MKFWFCETCGKRLTDRDLEEGTARNKQLKGVFCKGCAVGVMTLEMDAISGQQVQELARQQEAAAPTQHPPAPSRRIQTRPAQGQQSAPSSSLSIGFAVGAVVTLVLVVAVLAGNSKKPDRPPRVESNPIVLAPAEGAVPVQPSPPKPLTKKLAPVETPAEKPLPAPEPLPVPEPHPVVERRIVIEPPVPAEPIAQPAAEPPREAPPTEPEPATIEKVVPIAPTPALPAPLSRPATAEEEGAAAREWKGITTTIESRDFSKIAAAVTAFSERHANTKFLTERTAELKAIAGFAADGMNLENGLEGHWKFDDGHGTTPIDSSPNKNHGQIEGKPRWGPGKFGMALAFNGKDDFVDLPVSPSLRNIQEGDFSISAWVKPDNLPPGKDDDNDAAYGIFIKPGMHVGIAYSSSGKFLLTYYLKSDAHKFLGAARPSVPGAYHHVVGTISRKNGIGCLYVNGVLEKTDNWTPNATARDYIVSHWRIGIAKPDTRTSGWPFKGVLDEIRIYSRVLSPGEVGVLAGTRKK
jgi:hypothetical protein